MANTNTSGDGRSHNQPSHEAQVKGGERSHSGGGNRNMSSGSSGSSSDSGSHNHPSHEASVKGGENSHSGGRSGNR